LDADLANVQIVGGGGGGRVVPLRQGRENAMSFIGRLLLGSLVSAFLCLQADAETWPTKPLRVIVPIGAGSSVDLVARIISEQLSDQLGQRLIVENRPGAGQTLGAAAVAKAEPDGYTLLVNSSAHTIGPALYRNAGYQPTRDFIAVAPLGATPFVLVAPPERGFTTAADLVSAANAKPGSFNYSSPGVGSGSHLSAERFRQATSVLATHVPFKGGVEAMTEVMAGRIDFFFVVLGPALPHIRAGKLTALAVNGEQRSPTLPNVPTIAEAGFSDAANPTWFGLFLPARTPREIVDRLQREVMKALRNPKVRDKLDVLGVDAMPMLGEDFAAYVERQATADATLVQAIGLRPQ
jgi:tripartite-type tricarboxylate transporter receptor subunit TctC